MEKLQYFCDLCTKNGNPIQVVATTVKEKFGLLSLYYSGEGGTRIEWDIIDDIISQTERLSAQFCEVSGKYGELCHKGVGTKLCVTKKQEN